MSLLKVLKLIETNKFVETYRYFPDVVLTGGHFIERETVDNLVTEGYLKEIKKDSFGKLYSISGKGKERIREITFRGGPCYA